MTQTATLPTIGDLEFTILNATTTQELYQSQLHLQSHLTDQYRKKEDGLGLVSMAEINGAIDRINVLKSIIESKKDEVRNNKIERFKFLNTFYEVVKKNADRGFFDRCNKEAKRK